MPYPARGTGRALLISAALSIIAERGVGALRLRDVAERAGVSLWGRRPTTSLTATN